MGVSVLKLFQWVLFILSLLCTCSLGQFVPIDNYLIDCGSSSNNSVGNLVFVSDNSVSRLLSTPENIIANTTPNSISSPFGSRIYLTARIFNGVSVYTFPIQKPGRHWIRLHFFPFVFQSYNMSNAKFSVSTQQFGLLNDFQPSNRSMVKEFSANITGNELVLTFTPSGNSFAFLNALEVVSVPDELITDDANTINPIGNFQGLGRQALETIHRVNMGGPMISPSNDTLGRSWEADQGFLRNRNLAKTASNIGAVNYAPGWATREIAPSAVYGTAAEMNTANVPNSNFNVTWEFDVHPDFEYLIRFHFCDIVSTSLNQLYFNVYLDSRLVIPNFDLSQLTNALATPVYRDYIVKVNDLRKLSVSVGPSTDANDVQPNAILNGLEVMKMNNSDGSLDTGPFVPPPSPQKSKKKTAMIAGGAAGVVVLVAVAIIMFLMCKRRRLRTQPSKTWVPFMMNGGNTQSTGSKFSHATTGTTATNFGYRIPFAALQDATNNFNESWVIGVGGFGKVYRGVLKDGTKIAAKRGNPQSQQGLAEFLTEIEMLSQFRHRHLVSLIGYCDERNEMILIYEYMENGTLKSHLYGSEFPCLDWKQRLEICIGSARGLHYLHTGSTKAVIHRDVKSANILLDENLMAKVADFGLSKTGPDIDQTHVSTAVKGSFGYLDPEYFRRQQLTEKSDVYSFGVVLFEVLCARPVIDPSLPREMVNLGEWAMKYQRTGKLEQIIDPNLIGKVRPDSLRKFGETAEKCLAEYGVDRPSMADVLWNLEYALQLQEATNRSDPYENSTNQIGDISPLVNNAEFVETSMTAGQYSSIEDLSGTSMSKVFSQLVKAEGR
ncbi:Receptor-like protein kinase herk [Thalictrum thalictroides]|uniref:Receptor-like protein kinase herk n=1 Tax=Thalictrum thalictroides TaxID=46969 RepID=A0A7J6WMF9_THATH|nr:Receptor-like protein kinase herk [Thalictrum thalictroides]